jgi:hypothetical protein
MSHDRLHIQLDADRFFFAILVGARGARRRDRTALGYRFEAWLPLPIDEVQAVYRVLDGDRVLACGMPRERLAILVGACTPEPIRRVQAKRRAVVLAGLVLALLGFLLGTERRIRAHEALAGAARAADAIALERVLGPAAPGVAPVQRRAALTGTLRQLRDTRAVDALQDGDAGPLLAALLAHWPEDLGVHVEILNATASAITIRALCPDASTVTAWVQHLERFTEVEVEPPRVRVARDVVHVTLRIVARASEARS